MKNDSGIYTLTCIANGKIYVGQTTTLRTRRNVHFSELKRGLHRIEELQKDFNNYGKDAFVYEVLIKCKKKFLLSEENFWCNMLDTHNPERGYNIQPTNPIKNVLKRRQSSIDKCTVYKVKSVVMLTTDGVYLDRYNSCKEADISNNLVIGSAASVANKSRSHCKGYIFVFEEEYDKNKNYSIKVLRHKRNVLMYDKNMILLNDFESTNSAVRFIGGNQVSLWRALNGTRNTYMGYIWKFGDKQNEVCELSYKRSKLFV